MKTTSLLDMEEVLSRDEVYRQSWFLDKNSTDSEKMDVKEVFIPKASATMLFPLYKVYIVVCMVKV